MSKEIVPVKITTEFIKLDSLLKFSGMTETGGEAKEIVLQGLVRVNDEICTMRGKKVHPGDRVQVENYEIVVQHGG